MRFKPLILAALLAGGATAAHAEPGSFAYRTNPIGGKIRLDVSYVAPDNCHAILDIRRHAPGRVAVGARSIPVTVLVGPNPQGCSGDRVLRRVSTTFGGTEADLVEFFFVAPDGRLLKHVKSAIGT